MRVFLAAPLFSEAERNFNTQVAGELRAAGFDVWLAQEAPFIQKGSADEKRAIFDGDIEAVRNSDIILALLDGIDVDPGVAFELGYAHALGKPIFGLKTDYRTFSRIEEINLMLEVPIKSIFRFIKDAIQELTRNSARLRTNNDEPDA
jgi:nucleoside 2-deoxyribosyltransferase